ncbi:glycosyltransferase family 2 protein [Candidatus Nomurabacteria bacterium]|nr:glycosyltransferase family 2 protein [Candidatus Nomurabacteria bacterium]
MVGIDIIIVNWNSGRQLFDCLQSIYISVLTDYQINRIVIVDNNSTDNSLKMLDTFNLPVSIIRNFTNLGFAAACNQGAKESKAEYILLLNPDTILQPDSLQKSLDFLSIPENSKIGIVGIRLFDENNVTHRSCTRFPTLASFIVKIFGFDKLLPRFFHSYPMVEWPHDTNREVDHVIGAFYMVRRIVYEALCGLDEDYFFYLEDLDFSLRANQTGWKSFYLADAQAFHKGGGTSDQIKAIRLFYSLRSRIEYSFKHFTLFPASLIFFATLLIEPLFRVVLAASRYSFNEISETANAYYLLYKDMPHIFTRKNNT